jgi:hypothetical protein
VCMLISLQKVTMKLAGYFSAVCMC